RPASSISSGRGAGAARRVLFSCSLQSSILSAFPRHCRVFVCPDTAGLGILFPGSGGPEGGVII
ncbi:MAG: hypothetical protein Q8P44_02095, partial [Dehalococcoidia bacterium]|nr:hypothetical protein [Dehalococcoidia bacterium]